MWAVFECARLSKRAQLSFQRAAVVKNGVVGFSNGHSCQNGHGWVFEWVQLSKRVGWVFKQAQLSWLGVEREPVVEIGTSGF